MDALVRAALAGTARGGEAVAPDTPAGALVAQLPDLAPERRLLLLAGARAIERQAGCRPTSIAAPAPAPDERRPACSPAAARLLGELAAGPHADLLPEALGRLRHAGLRLPPGLLPDMLALGARDADVRPALLATMGERGPWLAAQNPAWRWAAEQLPEADGALPPDAETLWQEGTAARRLALLRLVRAHDPAHGRDWLAAVWPREKADFRAEAVAALAAGLSAADEAFLETALDDRSKAVRATAGRLLARLPGSALAARMRERADALLGYRPPAPPGGLRRLARAIAGGEPATGTLRVALPDACGPSWQRDGVEPNPPPEVGERAWWLTQVLALVPVAHWSGRFAATPEALIAAAARGEWGPTVIEGWSRAVPLAPDAGWAAALCAWWDRRAEAAPQTERDRAVASELFVALLAHLPRAEAERLVARRLARLGATADQTSPHRWERAAGALPVPWSATFGAACLTILRDTCREHSATQNIPSWWLWTFAAATRALPPACFSDVLAEWPVGDTTRWVVRLWQQQIDQFTETIRLRQRLMKEIPL
ncbi:MAG TPA: DUF5691 domain-containing protein [Thermomicrobiales bacterium]|nr:DUF5691 domain-containing protein [Thermomicrobiales bacterium]